jgi:BirA family biotin operon repressor/biotin-[acetyl-CoA-carboxylase] ligase
MNIIKLNAIDSTNSYLKKLSTQKKLSNFTVVSAEYQTNGRGQMGTIWQSNKDKNLIFSVLINFEDLPITHRFYISMAVSLGIIATLNNQFNVNFKIKWPNDILAEKDKVAGILIENTFRGTNISQAVIGIGLNVNQTEFSSSLQTATSLINLAKQKIDRDLLLQKLIENIQSQFLLLREKKFQLLKENYLKELYGYNIDLNFIDINENYFKGKIIGVAEDGKLEILTKNKTIRKFNLKEIKFTNS